MPYRVLDPSLAAAAPAVVLGAPLTGGDNTLSVLRDLLLDEVANRDDFDPTKLNRYINWSYQHISGLLDIRQLDASIEYTTVSDQPFYRLPDSVSWVKSAALTSAGNFYGGRKLLMTDDEQYRRLPERSGDPQNYLVFGSMIVLWPDPDAARTVALDVHVRPKPLSNDTDAPLLPPEMVEAIILGARSRVERNAQMLQQSHTSWNMMLSIIRPLLDADAQSRSDIQAHMQPVRSHRDLYRARAYDDTGR